MSISDIYREFDPTLPPPPDLKGVTIKEEDTAYTPDVVDPNSDPEEGDDSLVDDSPLDEDDAHDILDPPSDFSIISQTIRTGLDGTQVVDVVIEVEDVEAAMDYEVRITKT